MLSNQHIYSKLLSLEEAETVYKEHAHKDFPADELKPFSTIKKLWNNGRYKCHGFYGEEHHQLCAYAFIMVDEDTDMLLLDYLAVCEEMRGTGCGTAVLKLLKQDYINWNGIIFEVEDDDSTDLEEEKQIRRRRIAFYEKNGVVMTNVKSSVFGVDYKLMVMALGSAAPEEHLDDKITSVYKKMLPKKVFQLMFRLR